MIKTLARVQSDGTASALTMSLEPDEESEEAEDDDEWC